MERLIAISFLTVLIFQGRAFSQDLYGFEIYNFRKEKVFNQEIDSKNFKPEVLNAAIFYITNEIRKKNKLSFLTYSSALEKSASLHSIDMASDNFFSHTNPNNKKHREPDDRGKQAGIINPHMAENILEGFILVYTSGQEVIPGSVGVFIDPKTNKPLPVHTYLSLADELLILWMESPGHKANILSDKAIQLGCGTALFFMYDLNKMPCVKATQNFQWFESVQTDKP